MVLIQFREDGAAAFKDRVALTEINIKNTVIPKLMHLVRCSTLEKSSERWTTSFTNFCRKPSIHELCSIERNEFRLLQLQSVEEAFRGCTTLYGVADAAEDGKKIMYVGATTVPLADIRKIV